MTNTIDYYFSLFSPWAYFGDERFIAMAKKHGKTVRHHPMLSSVLFPATGGLALKDRSQQRKDLRLMELKRWSAHLGIPLNFEPKFFPVPEAPSSQLIYAAMEGGEDISALTNAIIKATWVEERDISDDDTLVSIADAVGFDGTALLAKSQDPRFVQQAEDETKAAITAGVFGYPTYIYGDEIFWGQDRLDFLDRALMAD